MVIKTGSISGSILNPTSGYIETNYIKGLTSPSVMTITGPNVNIWGDYSLAINCRNGRFTISGNPLALNNGSYSYSLPNKSGTVALTSDIPARPEVITTYSITQQQIANLSIRSGVNYYAFGTSSSNYYTPGNIGEFVTFQSTVSVNPQAFGFRLYTAFSNTRNWIIASTASFTATYITIYRPILI